MGQHRRPNTYGQDSAVYLHQKYPGHSFKDDNVKIVDRESDWFGRGVKEAIYERAEAPTLNRRGGLRFHLSGTWDRTVKEVPHIFRDDKDNRRVTSSVRSPASHAGVLGVADVI
jgi:hypothetical protein